MIDTQYFEILNVERGEYPPHLVKTPNEPIYKALFRRIWADVHWRNKNYLVNIFGMPRSGKSAACLGAGDYLGWKKVKSKLTGKVMWMKDFSVEHNVCATSSKLMEKIGNDDTIGSFYDWEEATVSKKGANARKFLSSENMAISDFYTIMGHKRHIVFSNQPFEFMKDKNLRYLSHAEFFAEKTSSTYNGIIGKFLFYRATTTKLLKIFPKVFSQYGRDSINKVIFPFCTRKTLQDYNAFQDAFKKEWEDELSKFESGTKKTKEELRAEKVKQRNEEQQAKIVQLTNEFTNRIDEFFNPDKGSINFSKMSRELVISLPQAYKVYKEYRQRKKENQQSDVLE